MQEVRIHSQRVSFVDMLLLEIQTKSLGMKVEIFDPAGNDIEHLGQPGELVCTRPHPSLPVMFWGDTPDHKKLRETYFSMYPGKLRFVSRTESNLPKGSGAKATLLYQIRRPKV